MANTPTRTYAPRIPRDEAERLIVEAAIDLLREGRFNEVSSRKIAEKAGVHAPTIARYFGSMNGLFAVVAKELARRDLTQLSARVDELADNSNLLLRSRLVAWCLFNGADPDDFMTSRETPAGRGLLARQSDFAGVSDRTTDAITEIYRFAFEGFAIMGQTHRFTAEQFADTMMLMQEIRRHLPEVEKALGWDEA
jgi:AcrR family transcriptional regulator